MQILRLPVTLLVGCAFLAAWTSIASAQLVPAQRFPMEVTADRGFMEGVEFRLRANDFAALDNADAITLTDMPLPGGPAVDLELRRARFDASAMKIYRDGQFFGSAPVFSEHTSWSGHVRGEKDSDVFLSFSSYGSRGWIQTQGRTIHLLASAGADGDWSKSTSRLIDESALTAHAVRNQRACGTDRLGDGLRQESSVFRGAGRELTERGLQPPLECKMAIETDFQLYSRFVDESAELVYLNQLLEAASDRYVEQINTYLNVIYLGYHTTQDPSLPNPDRWDAPDNPGADAYNFLYEFVNDWEQDLVHIGVQPNYLNPRPAGAVGATLNHFLSGATPNGSIDGLGFISGMCDPPFNYALSTNVAQYLTPFPVTQGPLNWDFFLFTHETGHNFGSPHTHDFCPPLDTCATGACNSTRVCMQGTIMSYCDTCPGGMNNINPVFHPACVDIMRAEAESCLPFHSEGSSYCFGDGLDPLVTVACPCSNFGEAGHGCGNSNSSLGGAELVAWGGVNPNTIVFTVSGVPNNTLCTFVRGTVNVPAGAPFGDGVRCYSGTTLRFGQQLSGHGGNPPNTAQAPGVTQTAGATRYYQAQYRNPSAGFCPPALFNVSNGWVLTW